MPGAHLLQSGPLRAVVYPGDGMNLHELWYQNRLLVKVDGGRFARGANYGVPLLYPSPGRVSGGSYPLGGGLEAAGLSHGLVRHAPFRVLHAGRAGIEAELAFDETFPGFARFPFCHRLTVAVTLQAGARLCWAFRLENHDTKPLPWGLGLHPFFTTGGDPVTVCANTPFRLVKQAGTPTGALADTAGTPYDITTPRPVDARPFDDAFTTGGWPLSAALCYPGFSIHLRGGPSFRHLVLFSPGGGFVCLEPQTCAPDAHNLHAAAFGGMAGLQWLAPGGRADDFVEFCFG